MEGLLILSRLLIPKTVTLADSFHLERQYHESILLRKEGKEKQTLVQLPILIFGDIASYLPKPNSLHTIKPASGDRRYFSTSPLLRKWVETNANVTYITSLLQTFEINFFSCFWTFHPSPHPRPRATALRYINHLQSLPATWYGNSISAVINQIMSQKKGSIFPSHQHSRMAAQSD